MFPSRLVRAALITCAISSFGLVVAQDEQFTIDALSRRSYDGGALKIERVMAQNSSFTRSLVSWDSDGLRQYGFMNVPNGRGPFPVVLALHGYVNPATYRTLTYTTRYADAIARAGFVVLHPNFRGHAPSEGRSNQYAHRADYAIDVLNLISSVRSQAGKPGALSKANGTRIGLWGHSMGGGIAIKVMTVKPDWVRAVALYGAMSGDELRNARQIHDVFSGGTRGARELELPTDLLNRLSPINYFARITAAVSVHHGTADDQVPYAWSVDLCERLKSLGKRAECFSYAKANHVFRSGSNADLTLQARVNAFFARELR
jgi:dipeptidyl aminopeptidase/acylaminoacyl peptidase